MCRRTIFLQNKSLCEVGFRPHGRPKGFPIALWKPSGSLRMKGYYPVCGGNGFHRFGKVYLQGCRPKGSRGNELPSGQSPKASFRSEAEADRSENPLVAPGKTRPIHKTTPKKKSPEILQDFRVMGQGAMPLAGALGAAPPTGVWGKAPQRVSKGQSPLVGRFPFAPSFLYQRNQHPLRRCV